MSALTEVPRDLAIVIEQAIDRHGLANVLDAIAVICADKADHIRTNWIDGTNDPITQAHTWDRASAAIRRVEASDVVRRVS